MSPESLKALFSLLDEHVRIGEEIVGVSGSLQKHLLAFDVESLIACIRRHEELQAQWETSASALAAWLTECPAPADPSVPAPSSVSEIADMLFGDEKKGMDSRIQRLRETMNSVTNVQAMALVQAERGSRLVRAYISLLRGERSAETTQSSLYTSKGHTRRGHIPSATLAHKA